MAGMPNQERRPYHIPEQPPVWFANLYVHFRMRLEAIQVAIELRDQGKEVDDGLIAEQLRGRFDYGEELAQKMSSNVSEFTMTPEIDFDRARKRLRSQYEEARKGFWVESLIHEEIEQQQPDFLITVVDKSIEDESLRKRFLTAHTYFQSVIELVIKGMPVEKAIRTLEFSGFENNDNLLFTTQMNWQDWLGLGKESKERIEAAIRPVVETMFPDFFTYNNLVEAEIRTMGAMYRQDKRRRVYERK
jgi:hypothetical protein